MSSTTPLAFDALAALVSSPHCQSKIVSKAFDEMQSCESMAFLESDLDHETKAKRWRAKAKKMRAALVKGGHLT